MRKWKFYMKGNLCCQLFETIEKKIETRMYYIFIFVYKQVRIIHLYLSINIICIYLYMSQKLY